ncbi:MAG: FAD-dependent oxidoreductase [Chromatiaceae bacterium]|nr:MAG: FAD-dependent oxidoreductase [Chromatiaceae bacterium]
MTANIHYDCIIVGGGVTGTALLYQLARFTNLKRLRLVEKYDCPAQVNSHTRNNSQTLHWGDIETHYSREKAQAMRRDAAMLVNYASHLPPRERDRILFRMPRMVLGVGAEESRLVRERYAAIRACYPRLSLFSPQEIADLEPNVALVDGAWRREEILAMGTPDDWSAVDFEALANSFSAQCVRIDRNSDRHVSQLFGTEVRTIRKDAAGYVLETSRGLMLARSVVVCAGGHSLSIAQRMGLGLEYACLPVAGSFYLAPEALHGKVYTVQNPRLPFPAIHGDRDIRAHGKTRFGPTALMLPMLDRRPRDSLRDYRETLRFDRTVAAALWHLLRAADTRNYLVRNLLYEVPWLNRHLFVRAIRKIVPDLTAGDIDYAEGHGGIRPQLIDRQTRRLQLADVRIIDGKGIVFNITPSPGGTSCLGNATRDLRLVADHLGARVDWDALERELLSGTTASGLAEEIPMLAEAG